MSKCFLVDYEAIIHVKELMSISLIMDSQAIKRKSQKKQITDRSGKGVAG